MLVNTKTTYDHAETKIEHPQRQLDKNHGAQKYTDNGGRDQCRKTPKDVIWKAAAK